MRRPHLALATLLVLAVAEPTSSHLPAQVMGPSVEIVAARWVRDKVLPESSAVVFERRTSVDVRQAEGLDRDPESSALIADAMGVSLATSNQRLACDSLVGCLSPEGYTSVGMGPPEINGAEATVTVFLVRRTAIAKEADLFELYRIRLKKNGDTWVVTGARVTVS